MAQHAVQVGRASSHSSSSALVPALKLLRRFGLHLLAILLGAILMLPFYWALSSSLKQVFEVRQIPPIWFPSVPQWSNYADVWRVRLFVGWIGTPLFLTAASMIGTVVSAAFLGHAAARSFSTVGAVVSAAFTVLFLVSIWYFAPTALEQTSLVTQSTVLIGATAVGLAVALVAGYRLARDAAGAGQVTLAMVVALLPGILFMVVNSGMFENYGWVSNTVFLTIVPTIGIMISTSLAGYAFARFRFPGKAFLFSITMATLMLPGYVLLIPNFLLFWKIGWLNTYLPLTVPFYFGGFVGGFYIFLFRQFFLTIPIDLDEAARIDGASFPRIFWSIVLPLSLPAFATAAIIEGIRQWNSFLLPFIILNKPEYYPLSVGLRYFVVSPADGQPKDHILMAAAVIMSVPVLLIFYFGQRHFVRGVAMTGIKG
ncbi:MAG: carbohydrate ABC transporter permease [Chloroflexota bacterium]